MLTYVFTVDDLARTRFAISPMFELVGALRMLRDPGRTPIHLPWIRTALPIAYELGLEPWLALMPSRGYIPDFLSPPPTTPLATFEQELELVRSTPVKQIRLELEIVARRSGSSAAIEAMRAHPRREVNRLCEAFDAFWRTAVEPWWPRIRSLLGADLRHRSRRLTEGGPVRLFEDLHPAVAWAGDRLEIDMPWTDTVELGGQGLLLLPSALEAASPVAVADPPWQPTLIYPSRGLALLWEPGTQAGSGALARLIGGTRADLLAALESPRSTTELARALGVSPGGVSQHLAVLRQNGLVEGERHGRSVLYLRTPAADSLAQPGDRDAIRSRG
jgi:DNA-binding transcriptional ArsR family regulator